MILIDIMNNTIIINESSSCLKPNQISQMYFWGFVKESEHGLYQLSSRSIESILPKLLNYFDKEEISFSLSDSCQEYLTKLNRIRDALKKVIDLGMKYKNGDFKNTGFTEFSSFVRSNIPRSLKDHQLKAAFHLYLVQNGANFSVPGSGKTAAVLSVYEKLKSEGKVNLIYVVGPPACFGPWQVEFELTLGRTPNVKILAGGDHIQRKLEYYRPTTQKAELYLTTYQTLLNDQIEVKTFLTQSGTKAFLVIDEAHYIKQLGGSWADAVLQISEYAQYRCILTGTPIPRSYTDVFNMFDVLWPNSKPIDEVTKKKIEIHQENNDIASAKKILKEVIGPLFYRVRKSDLNLIPPVFHPPYILSMNKYERLLYDAVENKIRDYSKQDYLRNIDIVRKLIRARIIRLRQCVSYPGLLATALKEYEESLLEDKSDISQIISDYDSLEQPAKLQFLTKLVTKLQKQNQKVVIWAHFIGTLKLITKHLTQKGYMCKLIYGETPTEQTSIDEEETREKIRNEFMDLESGLNILVANPAACGESISLHKTCYHAIYYDLSYNCAQYLQSLDRIHRVGGSEINQANYHFLQYKNTIDQDILFNLDKKASRMYELIEEDYNIYSLDMFEEDEDIEAYHRLFGGE